MPITRPSTRSITSKILPRSVVAYTLCSCPLCLWLLHLLNEPTAIGYSSAASYSVATDNIGFDSSASERDNEIKVYLHQSYFFDIFFQHTDSLLQPAPANYLLASYSPLNHFSANHRSLISLSINSSSIIPLPLRTKHSSPVKLLRTQAGFTLVEILVVVVILSIFAGMMSLSVGSSDSRKNRAFYEHLTDSLSYVRLLSAERMLPMGLSLQADKQGQVTPVIVTLSNPYISYQTPTSLTNGGSTSKNSMELSADMSSLSGANADEPPTPSWELEPEVSLPALPVGVSLTIQSLEASSINNSISGINAAVETRILQPWFSAQSVPQVLWFGTGQATPVTIEVRYDSRLVGEVITIMPDGSMMIGQSS